MAEEISSVTLLDELTEQQEQAAQSTQPRRQPPYHVVLWDDDEHSYSYVIRMMKRLFGFPREKGYQIADEVDAAGRVVCLTTTREHAELKRDQIHAFGSDPLNLDCEGSMWASIEPVPQD